MNIEMSHTSDRVKIIFCIHALVGGGAEKVLVDTVRNLSKEKYEITVLSLFNEGVYVNDIKNICNYKYIVPMPSSIIIGKIIRKIFLIIAKFMTSKILYKTCVRDDYDIEVAFLEGITTKVMSGSTNKRSKKYAWVHRDLVAYPYSTRDYISLEQEKYAYGVFDKVLCVSTPVRHSFIERYQIKPSHVAVQLNVLDEDTVIQKSQQPAQVSYFPKSTSIIAVGRLSSEKGFLMLVKVAARLKRDNVPFSLAIVGEGGQREAIEDSIIQNELNDTVKLLGYVPNPYPLIAKSDLLVSSSYAEGFSTVVSEAIILGIPVVTTASAGMTDILGDSQYGLITPISEDGLYEGLKRVLSDDQSLLHLKSMAVKRQKFFRLKHRISELDDLLLRGVINTKRSDHE